MLCEELENKMNQARREWKNTSRIKFSKRKQARARYELIYKKWSHEMDELDYISNEIKTESEKLARPWL